MIRGYTLYIFSIDPEWVEVKVLTAWESKHNWLTDWPDRRPATCDNLRPKKHVGGGEDRFFDA